MLAIANPPFISVEDYLSGEQDGEVRHEYLAGQVYAMAGTSEKHNRISLNLAFHLRAVARGTPCGVFIGDMKVRLTTPDRFYYPDVLVTCANDDREPFYKTAPCLIAEVLSPSTESTDRREKLMAYCALPTLRYYLLIAQTQRLVELYWRDTDESWRYQLYQETGALELNCPPLQQRMTLADMYEDVQFNDAVQLNE